MEEEKRMMLEEICNMFMTYGIRSVTMDDISRKLGISKKTLYQKFKDKRDIVEQYMISHKEFMCEFFEVEIHKAEDAISEILELMKMIREWLGSRNPVFEYDLHKYYPDIFKQHEKVKIEGIRKFYTHNYQRGIEEGYYRDDFDIDMMVKYDLTYITSFESAGFFTKEELLKFEGYRQFFIFHIRGIASAKGIEVLNNKLESYNFK